MKTYKVVICLKIETRTITEGVLRDLRMFMAKLFFQQRFHMCKIFNLIEVLLFNFIFNSKLIELFLIL